MAYDDPPDTIHVDRGAEVPAQPRTSIIILVTRDVVRLKRCLRTLAADQSTAERPEIIIVANGTPDSAIAALGARQEIMLIRSPVNHGFAGGCNLAIRFARGERLVFLNDDTAVMDGWLGGLHRALDADPRAAVAGSKVLLDDNRLQEAGCVLWSDGSTSGIGRGRHPGERDLSFSRPVDYVSFCSAMVRRDALTDAGWFDERYFPAYYEDVDLCLTLLQRGWAVTYAPESVVRHEEGGSADPAYRNFLSRRNQGAFVAKWTRELRDYEPAPATESDRAGAVQRALRRSAGRASRARTSAALAAAAPTPIEILDREESLALEVRHLLAAVRVAEEYTSHLQEKASRQGVRDIARQRLGPRIARIRQRIHPRGRRDDGLG